MRNSFPILSWILLPLLALTSPAFAGESLKSQLDAKRAAFLEKADPEKIAQYQEGIDMVAESGIYEEALKIGDQAPDFTLPNAEGKEVQLSKLLEKGPVVLTWYRGSWCPYCNIALAALMEELPALEKAGATLLAISPEKPSYTEEVVEKLDPGFEVLSDTGMKVARDYGIVFKMSEPVAEAMAKYNLGERNDDKGKELPLAASYVIDQDGTITYAFLDADYRNRAEPSRLVDAVEALQGEPDPEHLVLTFWENVWNPPYQLDLIDRLMPEDFVITSAGKRIEGRENFKEWVANFHDKAPGLRLENLEILTAKEGERVISRWKATAHNNGMLGSEPDQRPITFTGIAIWKIEDGKLAHNWVERSAYELSQELAEPAASDEP